MLCDRDILIAEFYVGALYKPRTILHRPLQNTLTHKKQAQVNPKPVLLFIVIRYKLQQVANFTAENGTHSCQNICIKASYIVAAVVVELCALKLCSLTELVFAQTCLFDKFIQFYYYFAVSFHNTSPNLMIDKSSLHKLDLKYKM